MAHDQPDNFFCPCDDKVPTQEITEGVQKSLRWAYENHDRAFKLCKQYSADLMPTVIQSHIDLYVNEFSLDVGTVGTEAVNFFFQQQRT
jgi:1,4-dihydroxy-6-naphthoate synthase